MKSEVLRRTFEAAKHPKGSKEREEFNKSSLTSEYMPSHKYMVRELAFMSDGTPNLAQKYYDRTFRSKTEAVAAQMREKNLLKECYFELARLRLLFLPEFEGKIGEPCGKLVKHLENWIKKNEKGN